MSQINYAEWPSVNIYQNKILLELVAIWLMINKQKFWYNFVKLKMLQASAGVLIRTDVATHIMLLEKDKKDKFKIMEIDDRHLFIKSNKLDLVKEYVLKFKEDSLRRPMPQQ